MQRRPPKPRSDRQETRVWRAPWHAADSRSRIPSAVWSSPKHVWYVSSASSVSPYNEWQAMLHLDCRLRSRPVERTCLRARSGRRKSPECFDSFLRRCGSIVHSTLGCQSCKRLCPAARRRRNVHRDRMRVPARERGIDCWPKAVR
jgi:hypothetical protein